MRLHTKVQRYMRCDLRQDIFSCFPYINLCEICDPRGRAMNADIPMIVFQNTPSVHLTVYRGNIRQSETVWTA